MFRKILQESINPSRLRRRNIAVPNQLGKATARRFSADDIEPSSKGAESEAVVSDVDANFKVSPKIRPVKSTRLNRKRLWSSKADFASWQPNTKKKVLERAESCPATEIDDVENWSNSLDSAKNDPKSALSSPTSSVFSSPINKDKITSSCDNSPICANSVNRRTSVLFRKKRRRRTSNLNSPSSDSTSDITSDYVMSPEMTKQSDSDAVETARSKPDETFLNGFDSLPGKIEVSKILLVTVSSDIFNCLMSIS